MLEELECHPRPSHWETSPHPIHDGSPPERVGKMMHGPAAGTVSFTGSYTSRLLQLFHEINQRQFCFRQVAHARRPVIHLQIDIGMEIGVPGSLKFVVPYTL